ncbi:MAG: class I SAM-dependent methyltransferase [Solirubrobacteraceae bacterium MAG38_C4-C5]|nr:class I SAM-dependent methyltransferase [Candidatus Siliceabacter maunaloa]
MTIDPRAASGFAAADAYQRGRPSYPKEAIDRLLGALQLSESSRVLDLAAGTGQVGRALRGRVGVVTAVEPAAAMRAELAGDLPPEVVALEGTAEAIPLPNGAVQGVVVGEAFHWFDVPRAAREIARVLTDDGGTALLWNVPTWTTADTPWLEDFRRIVAEHRRAAGAYPAGENRWREQLDATRLFEPLVDHEVPHRHVLGVGDFLALVASWSWIANLPRTQQTAVLTDVEALMRSEKQVVIPYRTEVYWTHRRVP